MFQNLEVLSRSRHAHLRLKAHPGFAYAASQWLVPLVHHEVPMIAREIPVVFSGGDGAMPMALLGAGPGSNMHVNDKGQWVGRYIPAHIRRYPFILGELPALPQSEQAVAAGDAASGGVRHVVQFAADAPHLAGPEGAPLVTDAGPTPELERVMGLLQVLQKDFERTRALVRQLDELSLLSVKRLTVSPKKADPVEIKGLRLVDPQAFAALSGEALKALRDTGALALVHAHFFSLTNLRDGLIGMQGARLDGAAAAKPVVKAGMLPADTDLNFDDIDWSKFSRGT